MVEITYKQAKEKFDLLMKQLLEKNPIDENLKNTDPLKWVGLIVNVNKKMYKNLNLFMYKIVHR